ncbi:hypothetical protein B0H13DRAFT_2054077 [Mycena leptocephala]|nr:hypothetical protein B0H13DRAFT_2054077 [Mycena leptocephala]
MRARTSRTTTLCFANESRFALYRVSVLCLICFRRFSVGFVCFRELWQIRDLIVTTTERPLTQTPMMVECKFQAVETVIGAISPASSSSVSSLYKPKKRKGRLGRKERMKAKLDAELDKRVEDSYQFTLKILGQYASPEVMKDGVRQALVAPKDEWTRPIPPDLLARTEADIFAQYGL